MDPLRQFLDTLKSHGLDRGHTRGLFQLLIGRGVARQDGTPVARGLTWRQLAALLKKVRWRKDAVLDLGLDPATLPPRDREQYWYMAILQSKLDSAEAKQAGEALAELLPPLGHKGM